MLRLILGSLLLTVCSVAAGQPPPPVPDSAAADGFRRHQRAPLAQLPDPVRKLIDQATPLNPGKTVFLDREKKCVYLHTEVVCRDCVLEMLCVPIGQREHETILNVRARAFVIHSALLALGLKPGQPVRYSPEFQPPVGPALDLQVHWVDADGQQHHEDVRSWIRHSIHRYFSLPLAAAPPGVKLPHEELRYDPYNKEIIWYGPMTDKQRRHLLTLWDDEKYQQAIGTFFRLSQSRPMDARFVFTGSNWVVSELTGERRYAAEDGHFITVANFPAATIDVSQESSASDGGQLYEGWGQKIPPAGTPVLLQISAAADPGAAPQKPAPSADRPPKDDRPKDEPSSSSADSDSVGDPP